MNVPVRTRVVGNYVRYEVKVTCSDCKKDRWISQSNFITDPPLRCSTCARKKTYLPLGQKWKGKLTPVEILGSLNGRIHY